MIRAYTKRNKAKTALVLAALTAILLLANWSGLGNVKKLDKTLAAMMNDRLLPATFVHEISNRIYENKLTAATDADGVAKIKANYAAIEVLAKKYEATQLTREESARWKNFRAELRLLQTQETDNNRPELVFVQALESLDQLILIQVSESNRLLQNAQRSVSLSTLTSNLGAAICIGLALFIIVLLDSREKLVLNPDQRHLLN
jgi:hypothetical protein